MRKNKVSPLFAVPAWLIYTVLLIIPILYAFVISLTKWNGVTEMTFVGLDNFVRAFSDKRLGDACINTLIISSTVVISVNIVGLALAILLNKAGRHAKVFRAAFFIPYVLSTVAVSFIWKSIFSYTGVINGFLEILGIHARDFLGKKGSALVCICIVEFWRTLGFYMVLYLAALQTVPEDLYEACTLDGGSAWDKFRYITLPMIIPGATVSLLLSVINELRVYDVVKVLTDGGPGYSTETVVYNIVTQGFGNNAMGYSCALAVLLFVVLSGITVIINTASSRLGDNQ